MCVLLFILLYLCVTVTLSPQSAREDLRDIKVVTSEKVWSEWAWMREALVDDLLIIGCTGLAIYLLCYKRSETFKFIGQCLATACLCFSEPETPV